MTAEHDVRDLQPRPVIVVVDVGDEMNVDRDRHTKVLGVPDERLDEPGIRQDSEVGSLRFLAEHLHRVFDGAHRGEVGKSHPAAVRSDQHDAQGRGAAVDDAPAEQSPPAQVGPDRQAHRVVAGQRAQLDLIAQSAQHLRDMPGRSAHLGAQPGWLASGCVAQRELLDAYRHVKTGDAGNDDLVRHFGQLRSR